ncbi:differentially expressed in FDCP 8 homolog [Malaya genurostris]|uniref:differentially expressed in FDCP 8 homolog n=1 Tax=Malaya genurostris TaxID=325434 RepID=UPI0026F3D88F|nr:differentially expressed in FDCP 8 homolog [Malaya genurostris]XP_058461603.1 differentially expressed in FDCP 8 homolog [Malaya genurostris]XP_058461604.1 differentially expressed in FDCP 8 homolog [Malaya genurostris]
MQTVKNLKDGLLNLPSEVHSFLGRNDGQKTNLSPTVNTDSGDKNNNMDVSDAPVIIDDNVGTANCHDIADSDSEDDIVANEATVGTVSSNSLTLLGNDILTSGSHAIPYVLIKEKWQLVLEQDATIPEIQSAIEKCKDMVLRCVDDAEARKWFVRHLIELRHRLRELQDVDNDPDAVPSAMKVILGHHFQAQNHSKCKVYCDHCSGIIWSVVQASYICTDCSYAVHHKCIRNVIRVCAHVVTAERNLPIECICPEIGLAFQRYTCAECGAQLSCNSSTAINCFGVELKAEKLNSPQPRLCDYSGFYYCSNCHWNDISVIPARVTNNWDFVPRKVCRASLQQIRLICERAIINLEQNNPRLFALVPKLMQVKKIRQKLLHMKRYLTVCRIAEELKLIRTTIGARRHLMQTVDIYSVTDLVEVDNGHLLDFLCKVYCKFEGHIRNCLICSGKAYICENCNSDEILFPFDDHVVSCAKCFSVNHQTCQLRNNMKCQKCVRLRLREQQMRNEFLDAANGN